MTEVAALGVSASTTPPLEKLDHQRRSTDHSDQALDVLGRVSETGYRKPDATPGEQLETAQFVA